MSDDPLHRLHAAGQAIWLDFIDREILRNGDLVRRIHDDTLTGMTSNPTIFEKALAEGSSYDDQICSMAGEHTAMQLFEIIATTDVRDACDAFRDVHDQSGGADGFVSIEVSPAAANDVRSTVTEAHRLWDAVNRPNVMIKVPGTVEGASAVARLIADGINVNITLLFAIEAHRRVIEAYMYGLEERVKAGKPISGIHSVASFFVSRVDTDVDARLSALGAADALKGKAAIANARMAYKLFQEQTASPRWQALAAKGATVQRPLWASTSTKNPAYRDVMYVEELIGPDTVNTMPPQTITAFRDHGRVDRTVDRDVASAEQSLRDIEAAGVSMVVVTDRLLGEGLASFQKSFDTLIAGLERKSRSLGIELLASQ